MMQVVRADKRNLPKNPTTQGLAYERQKAPRCGPVAAVRGSEELGADLGLLKYILKTVVIVCKIDHTPSCLQINPSSKLGESLYVIITRFQMQ